MSIKTDIYILIYFFSYNTSITDIEHSPNYSAFSLPQTHQVIFIYIYVVLFGPVKAVLGVIPSGQKKKTFNSEHLNFPGKELNVTDVTEQ